MKIEMSKHVPKSFEAPFSPTIFHESWWLHLASNGDYREVNVEIGGHLAGRLPFILNRQFRCLSVVHIPKLTHCLGPALAPAFERQGIVKPFKSIEIYALLLKQLPKSAHIWFRLHPATTNTLAFERAGFSNNVQWSIEIDPAPAAELWRQMRDKTRNAIRRAEELLRVESPNDAGFFLDFYNDCLREAGRKNSYDEDCLKQLIPEALHRGRGRVLTALGTDGTPQAAIFTVWDAHREYYFMSTRRTQAHFGAINLLIWCALQNAALQKRIFDMDGIHVTHGQLPNLLLLSGFGGRFAPRYCVSRTALNLVQSIRGSLSH